MARRNPLWILASALAAQLGSGCHSDEQVDPPGERSPDVPPRLAPPPEVKTPLAGHMTLLAPGQPKKILSIEDIAREFKVRQIETEDPNYGVRKTFFVVPLAPLLQKHVAPLEGARLLLVANDGYSVEVDAALLLSEDAFLALGDSAPGVFAPIGERKVNAGPTYLVWRGAKYSDEKLYPRPWSLTVIEKLDTADRYKHTRPEGGFGTNESAERGYEIFSATCIRCHAINREGGRLGPDLNVPQNVLAYRPEEQVRAYIRDPETFRYSSMPAHPGLSQTDLNALIAYLRLMGENQHDPAAD